MITRKFLRLSKYLVRFWPFVFLVLWMTVMILFSSLALVEDPSIVSSSIPTIKWPKIKIALEVETITKEEVLGFLNIQRIVLRTYGSFKFGNVMITEVKFAKRNDDAINYLKRPFHSKIFLKGKNANVTNHGFKTDVMRYFEAIRTTTGECRRLVQLGGELNCNKTGDENGMDGNKLICIDKVFQIATNSSKNCLVLSFGIRFDTSFDEAISDLECDVHMFDVRNYEKEYLKKEKKLHFHQMGVHTKQFRYINTKKNDTLDFETFNNIVVDLQLDSQLINVLKMDIEGTEWDVLLDISSQPFLNIIGQIAVEVHAGDLIKLNNEERIQKVNHWISVIQALEERGFRRVAFFENRQQKHLITDVDGTSYEMAGEMLLINYNWYDEDYRKKVKQTGYNFI